MNKILMVIIFLGQTPDGYKDLYVLETPSFKTTEQCYASLGDEKHRGNLIDRLHKEYGGFKPIEKIICSPEKTVYKTIGVES